VLTGVFLKNSAANPPTCYCLAREETSEQAAVLHYTYNRFEDLKSRRDRCDCAPTEEDAKRCFILPFDRMVCPICRLNLEQGPTVHNQALVYFDGLPVVVIADAALTSLGARSSVARRQSIII
jgi:hypothetical protein